MENNKNKTGMLIIIIILVPMLVVCTVAFGYTISLLNKTKAAVENGSSAQPQIMQEEVPIEDQTKHTIADVITTNLLPSEGELKGHMLIVQATIIMNKESKDYKKLKLETLIPANEVIIKSIIIDVIRNKTYDEVQRPDSKQVISNEILEKLQNAFGTNAIIDVIFSDFKYQ